MKKRYIILTFCVKVAIVALMAFLISLQVIYSYGFYIFLGLSLAFIYDFMLARKIAKGGYALRARDSFLENSLLLLGCALAALFFFFRPDQWGFFLIPVFIAVVVGLAACGSTMIAFVLAKRI